MGVKGVGIKEFLAERSVENPIVENPMVEKVSKGQSLRNIAIGIAIGATIGGVFIFIDSFLG
jgi:hypothetical protein